MKPSPNSVMPNSITARGPKRSTIQPCTGPRNPLSMRCMENATDSCVRLQPKSCSNSFTYDPNAWNSSPPPRANTPYPASTTTHP